MKIKVECGSINDIDCDLLVVNEFEGIKHPGGATGSIDKALGGLITELSAAGEIDGKLESAPIIHTQGKIKAKRVIVAGLGDRQHFNCDKVRVVSAAVIRKAKQIKAKKIVTIVHGAGSGCLDPIFSAKALVEGAIIADYSYDDFKSEKKTDDSIEELIIIDYDPEKVKSMKRGAELGETIALAVNRARSLVNGPSNKITPSYMADYAKKLADENGLKCEIFDANDVNKLGMQSFLAVAQGSKEPLKLVVLTYDGKGPKSEKIGLVGKGVTFDAGGISIKPSKGLDEMKTDMAGAAAVIEIMSVIAKLKIKKSVIAVVPLTENMPSGHAIKPGDIVGTLEGKTIEIISTDAEGRMILSDALTYARKLGATKLIDLATLTGGCVKALGDVAAGIFSNDQEFLDKVIKAGNTAGERHWQLPLFDEYNEYIKSSVADIKNCNDGGKASPSVGAVYLKNFVGKVPWIHIDIAGTAYLNREIGYLTKGATGAGIRTVIEYLLDN